MPGSAAGSHRGSASGSQAGSRPGSQTGSPSRVSSPHAPKATSGRGASGSNVKPLGYDPGRDPKPELREVDYVGKRVDLPADAYLEHPGQTRFTRRPEYSTQGKPIQVQLNIFPVTGFEGRDIYQYDVSVSPEVKDAKALMKKLWSSEAAKKCMASSGSTWLFDGLKLAWSSKKIVNNEWRAAIDLSADKPKKAGKSDVFYIKVKQSAVIRLEYLHQYLQGKIGWDNHVLECMNFFDHCMRQSPSEKMESIRRNFYPKGAQTTQLGRIIEVQKGYYAAARLSESKALMINVDTANTAFWQPKTIAEIALRMVNAHKDEWASWGFVQLAQALRPKETQDKQGKRFVQSEVSFLLRRLQKVKFVAKHRGKMQEEKLYVIKQFVFEQKYGKEGANAENVTFKKKLPDGTEKETSVWQHYLETYDFRLQYPKLPIIQTTRGGLFPMELCNIADFQRYPFKLDPTQTSAMIKFAVTRPAKRKADIIQGFQHLNYANDPYLAAFGIKVEGNMKITNARLLKNPEIEFANGKHNPGVSGRWDLRGKRFLEPNTKKISSWGLVVCGNACSKQDAEAFGSKFTQAYRNHGADIGVKLLILSEEAGAGDPAEICAKSFQKVGDYHRAFPQIIFFVVRNKNSIVYERIKKNMDCRFVCPSQVLQGGQVQKANAQYMSNVAMKVNAKLGGATCKVASAAAGSKSTFFNVPTMMIGVDVSHSAPGSGGPSLAAMSVSLDKNATRYAAAVETNGWRQELLQATTCQAMFPPLLKSWMQSFKTSPQHVYYLRDGVAEGQFQDVIEKEIAEIRRSFRECQAPNPKITVLIATKRHHIRFFPKPNDSATGDRNGNPLPGTLVERDATHPHHFDFYLCSHVAIQGTARPVHYQVIYDDAKVKPDDLQKMIYQQCYQYVRSTTPVSLHPAVYYAHVASNRAKSHEDISSSEKQTIGGKADQPIAKHPSDVPSHQTQSGAPLPLLPMYNANYPKENAQFMKLTMWYI
ncbi:Piwi domain-containing protein [Nemania sp. FL0916]|nr:Piwi domain-containing protein [Nemania sp. FL0916]